MSDDDGLGGARGCVFGLIFVAPVWLVIGVVAVMLGVMWR